MFDRLDWPLAWSLVSDPQAWFVILILAATTLGRSGVFRSRWIELLKPWRRRTTAGRRVDAGPTPTHPLRDPWFLLLLVISTAAVTSWIVMTMTAKGKPPLTPNRADRPEPRPPRPRRTAMTPLFGWMPGMQELLVIGFISLLIFGNRLPSVMRSLGKSVTEFKKGVAGIEDDLDTGRDRRQEARSSSLISRPKPSAGPAARGRSILPSVEEDDRVPEFESVGIDGGAGPRRAPLRQATPGGRPLAGAAEIIEKGIGASRVPFGDQPGARRCPRSSGQVDRAISPRDKVAGRLAPSKPQPTATKPRPAAEANRSWRPRGLNSASG